MRVLLTLVLFVFELSYVHVCKTELQRCAVYLWTVLVSPKFITLQKDAMRCGKVPMNNASE